MADVFRHLHMPANLACEFLAVFSRMEYALKVSGYAIGTSKVDAWWDKFANDVEAGFNAVKGEDFLNAVGYISAAPPRKQILKDNVLTFTDQAIDKKQGTAQQVLLMVRTVRNNLFHGGKFLPDGEQEIGRNERLVASSLIVLKRCVTLNDKVHQSYDH
jgi:hypothetical protein